MGAFCVKVAATLRAALIGTVQVVAVPQLMPVAFQPVNV